MKENENEIEQLLEKICREQLEPPEHLVVYTKHRLKHSRFLNTVIFLSLLFNALVMTFFIVGFFLPGLTWPGKILWYFGSTTLFNGLIVLILLKREKLAAFFLELNYAVELL